MSKNQLDKKSQAWSALFSEPMSDLVKRYTSSVFFDKRMWQADITGSLAHAEMLAAQGIINADDHASIVRGMAQITADIESGNGFTVNGDTAIDHCIGTPVFQLDTYCVCAAIDVRMVYGILSVRCCS